MAFISGWFNRRTAVPTTDLDVEAQTSTSSATTSASVSPLSSASNANSSAIELSRPSTREEDGMVIVDSAVRQPPSSVPDETLPAGATLETAAAPGNQESVEQELTNLVESRLRNLKKASQAMIVLTVLQIMSTLSTEHIHFLSLFSLFVPWTGYEGAKERNAWLRFFYWGCWIMIPANFFHLLSFDQFVDDIMATNLEDNLRRELIFNHTLFQIVTGVIMVMMTFCLVWVRQLSVLMRTSRQYADNDFLAEHNRRDHHGRAPSGPLQPEEIAAIPATKMSAEDIAPESGEKDVCVVCQDDFQVNDLVKRLNCRHVFHAQCIDTWLERSNLCPICNGDVRSIV